MAVINIQGCLLYSLSAAVPLSGRREAQGGKLAFAEGHKNYLRIQAIHGDLSQARQAGSVSIFCPPAVVRELTARLSDCPTGDGSLDDSQCNDFYDYQGVVGDP